MRWAIRFADVTDDRAVDAMFDAAHAELVQRVIYSLLRPALMLSQSLAPPSSRSLAMLASV